MLKKHSKLMIEPQKGGTYREILMKTFSKLISCEQDDIKIDNEILPTQQMQILMDTLINSIPCDDSSNILCPSNAPLFRVDKEDASVKLLNIISDIDAENYSKFHENSGINIIQLPAFEMNENLHYNLEEFDKLLNNKKIIINKDDYVVPICHEGMNRSQILKILLLCLKMKINPMGANEFADFADRHCDFTPTGFVAECERDLKIRDVFQVEEAHGAETGYDPYQGYTKLDDDSVFTYLLGKALPYGSEGEWLHTNFRNVFGITKSKRIGQQYSEATNIELNPIGYEDFKELESNRKKQREFMNNTLYNVNYLRNRAGSGRIIIFTFYRAFKIYLDRFIEQNPDAKDLNDIFIIAMPYADNISRAGGPDELKKYTELCGTTPERDYINGYRHLQYFDFLNFFIKICDGEKAGDAVRGPAATRGPETAASRGLAARSSETEAVRRPEEMDFKDDNEVLQKILGYKQYDWVTEILITMLYQKLKKNKDSSFIDKHDDMVNIIIPDMNYYINLINVKYRNEYLLKDMASNYNLNHIIFKNWFFKKYPHYLIPPFGMSTDEKNNYNTKIFEGLGMNIYQFIKDFNITNLTNFIEKLKELGLIKLKTGTGAGLDPTKLSSYEKKYIKYKNKYLALKMKQKNTIKKLNN